MKSSLRRQQTNSTPNKHTTEQSQTFPFSLCMTRIFSRKKFPLDQLSQVNEQLFPPTSSPFKKTGTTSQHPVVRKLQNKFHIQCQLLETKVSTSHRSHHRREPPRSSSKFLFLSQLIEKSSFFSSSSSFFPSKSFFFESNTRSEQLSKLTSR